MTAKDLRVLILTQEQTVSLNLKKAKETKRAEAGKGVNKIFLSKLLKS